MCVPACMKTISKRLSRRSFIGSALATAASYSAIGCAIKGKRNPDGSLITETPKITFSKAVDLTHTLSADFPNFFGKPLFKVKAKTTFKKDHFNTNQLDYFEHIGTHIDAPIHFSASGKTVEKIPVEDLVVPLHVIDIRAKADKNADAQLTLEDIQAYETTHGKIKSGSCVAMLSGWDKRAKTKEFRNVDSKKVMHFPGFSVEAAKYLAEERNVTSIGVDTLSLDIGASKDFGVHYFWLPSGRFGLECLANLEQLPQTGATIVVGAPKFAGCTGGPSRIIALV